jgi:hypothetical protein
VISSLLQASTGARLSLSEKTRGLLSVLLVIIIGVANVAWRLETPGDWWFEDDPYLYAAILNVASPWLFFYDVAANRLATGPNELAPVLLSSMWLDLWLAPRSTVWAYSHNALVYLATALAFYFAMRRLLRERWLALSTTIAWMLLPSTTVLVEFLSTRHYMIGLFWALLAAMSVDDALKARPGKRGLLLARVASFIWLSIISKEFFPPAVLTLTFLWFIWRRDWRGAAIPLALGAAYAVYRALLTEPSLVYYNSSLMSLEQTLKLLLRLPYMTYAGWAGYAALGFTCIRLWRKAKADADILPVVLIGAATLAVSLAVIYPVGDSLNGSWRSLGTWYRTPCVINTLLLVGFAYAVGTLHHERERIALMTLLLIVTYNGSQRTAQHWNGLKAEQAAEADFVLSNPGKTLVSQLRAVWFLPGVKMLYEGKEKAAFVHRWQQPHTELYRQTLESSSPFWIYQDGKVREGSEAIRQRLLAE